MFTDSKYAQYTMFFTFDTEKRLNKVISSIHASNVERFMDDDKYVAAITVRANHKDTVERCMNVLAEKYNLEYITSEDLDGDFSAQIHTTEYAPTGKIGYIWFREKEDVK